MHCLIFKNEMKMDKFKNNIKEFGVKWYLYYKKSI